MKSLTQIILATFLSSIAFAHEKVAFLGPPQPIQEESIYEKFASLNNGCEVGIVSHRQQVSSQDSIKKRGASATNQFVTVKQDVNLTCVQGSVIFGLALYNTKDNEIQLEFDPLSFILNQGYYSNDFSLINNCELKLRYVITSTGANDGSALFHQETLLRCVNGIGLQTDRVLYRSSVATSYD